MSRSATAANGTYYFPTVYNTTDFIRCPSCNSEIRVDVFPALFEKPTGVQSGQSLIVESEPSCFYHEKKKGVVTCESCGRFLSALCDVELSGQHLCPGCLQVGKEKGKLRNLEDHRTLYDNIALGLAILPVLLMVWPSVVTAPMSVFMTARHSVTLKTTGLCTTTSPWAWPFCPCC